MENVVALIESKQYHPALTALIETADPYCNHAINLQNSLFPLAFPDDYRAYVVAEAAERLGYRLKNWVTKGRR